jgi:hypothetical protein
MDGTDGPAMDNPTIDGVAARLARGVCRHLGALGYATLTEFALASGRRVDVIAIDGGGTVVIVEIKSCLTDFRTDRKWPEYLEFCDAFYFAVGTDFPRALLPAEHGLMVADAYGAEIVRPAPAGRMNGSRRRAQLLRVALTASQRLQRLVDPAGS